MKFFFRIIFSFVPLFMILDSLSASAQTNDYSIYANIIYRMTKYMEWPESNSKNFEIGVVGESLIIEKLIEITNGQSVNGLPVIVSKYTGDETVYTCSILFIPDPEIFQLKYISKTTASYPVLIVSETKDSAIKGSCINFSIVNDHIVLELNQKIIKGKNIKVSSEFIKMCKLINQ